MKHISTGLPYEPLYNVCNIKTGVRFEVIYPENVTMFKEGQELRQLANEHGYDEYEENKPRYEQQAEILNRIVREDAIRKRMRQYYNYRPASICRCGNWIFSIGHSGNEECREINESMLENRGGIRKGAGRKGNYSKLAFSETSVLRVPKDSKEDIKELINWLIKMKAEGKDVKSVITSALFLLQQKAEETQSDLPDLADKYRTGAEILLELYNRLPDFYITK